jgi:hypothetical protein
MTFKNHILPHTKMVIRLHMHKIFFINIYAVLCQKKYVTILQGFFQIRTEQGHRTITAIALKRILHMASWYLFPSVQALLNNNGLNKDTVTPAYSSQRIRMQQDLMYSKDTVTPSYCFSAAPNAARLIGLMKDTVTPAYSFSAGPYAAGLTG